MLKKTALKYFLAANISLDIFNIFCKRWLKPVATKTLKLFCKNFCVLLLIPLFCIATNCLALTNQEIQKFQMTIQNKPTGERIAFWAKQFIGTPYDTDINGIYVTQKKIVSDNEVDCMYLVFRCVELGLSNTPQQAINTALDKRFFTQGILQNGKITNYNDRFQYGEDMLTSGKWGKEITTDLGITTKIAGNRDHSYWDILATPEFIADIDKLKSGDIVFFIVDPLKRTSANESVGHMGIADIETINGKPIAYLIHAHGKKSKPEKVEKIPLVDYIKNSRFIGAQITRF